MATELGDRAAGYSFTPPEGWGVEEEPGRFALTGPSGTTGAIVVAHAAANAEELRPLFEQGWIEPGVELKPDGQAEVAEDEVEQRLAGKVQGQEAVGLLVVKFSPHGGGVLVIGLGPANDDARSELESGVRDIASHVRFSAPETSELVESWDSAIRGKTLTYLHTYDSGGGGGGMAEKHEIALAEDGSFEEYRESSVVIDVEGGGASDPERTTGQGTWTIRALAGQAVLELTKPDTTDTHVLTRTGEEVFLGDQRYFVT
jgi:hypothetical protein